MKGCAALFKINGASLATQRVHNLLAIQETQVQSLGRGRSPGEGNVYPLQYSCLENSMDRGAWQATVHGISKSRTQLKQLFFFFIEYMKGCSEVFKSNGIQAKIRKIHHFPAIWLQVIRTVARCGWHMSKISAALGRVSVRADSPRVQETPVLKNGPSLEEIFI